MRAGAKKILTDLGVVLTTLLALLWPVRSGAANAFSIDGNLSDWSVTNRIDAAPWQQQAGITVYGQIAGGTLYLSLSSQNTPISAKTTVWLNTDQNTATGYQIWGFAGGVEYRLEVGDDLSVVLSDVSGPNPVSLGPVTAAFSADRSVLEVAVPLAALHASGGFIDVLADINDSIFLPSDYALPQYTVSNQIVTPTAYNAIRVAVVFSPETASHYFYDKAYTQLALSLQHQSMMAGVPYDFISIDELTDINNITRYRALIIPYASNIAAVELPRVEDTLYKAVYQLGIGVMTSGDFFVKDENDSLLTGDPYLTMKKILGLTIAGGSLRTSASTMVSGLDHAITRDVSSTDSLFTYSNTWINFYQPAFGQATDVLADDVSATEESAAVFASANAPIVHFNTPESLAYTNLAWRSIQWLVFGDHTTVTLKLTRNNSLFVSRNDMDQSMWTYDTTPVTKALLTLLKQFKSAYNFVGSYYINIGNDPANSAMTDWKVSKPIYKSYLALGNEIGTHSYTHPLTLDKLTAAQLEFEFLQSKLLIEKKLDIKVQGTALPGNPESLATARIISQWFSYMSGSFSGETSGYPGAIGFFAPDDHTIYFSPNLFFDYTMIGVKKWTAAQAQQKWSDQFDALTKNASQPIIHWPWHDYGPTTAIMDGYSVAMYESLIKKAYESGTEFVTASDADKRIRKFVATDYTESRSGNKTTVTIPNPIILNGIDDGSGNYGTFSLRVRSGSTVSAVKNWYAYNSDRVFLPDSGGRFEITTGGATADVTHITALPMRARLKSVSGDGKNLDFTFEGNGTIKVKLSSAITNASVNGATSYQVKNGELSIVFDKDSRHEVKISNKEGKKK
jgi:serralysin